MATLTSDKVSSAVPIRTPDGPGGDATVVAKYSLAAALAAADVIQMVKVPAGAIVYDVWVKTPDLDTGGSPAITFTVGDGGDPDRYITSTAAGTAAALTRMNAPTAAVATSAYTTDDTIDITIDTGPATGATTGDIYLMCRYGTQR